MNYNVYTKHEVAIAPFVGTGNRFIVPIPIDAETPLDAAVERFGLLCGESQSSCTALLVTQPGRNGIGEPQLFKVQPDWKVLPA